MNRWSVSSICLLIIAMILVGYLLFIGKSIAIPFVIALMLSILISPSLQSIKSSPKLFYFKAALGLLFVSMLFTLFGQIIQNEFARFHEQLPNYQNNFAHWQEVLYAQLQRFKISVDPKQFLNSLDLQGMASDVLNSIIGVISNLVVILFFMIFILLEMRILPKKLEMILPEGKNQFVLKTIESIYSQVQKYSYCKTIISLGTAVASYIPLKFFGVDFAFFCALLIFLLNFIPYFGSLIASAVPVLICLVQFPTLGPAVGFLIYLALLQVSIGNLIEPRILGNQMNISPLIVLLSLFIWGSLWGVTGAILAIPIVAILNIILHNIKDLKPIAILISNPSDV